MEGLVSLKIFNLKGNQLRFIQFDTFKFLTKWESPKSYYLQDVGEKSKIEKYPGKAIEVLNLSNNKINESFSNWIINQLISDLSRVNNLYLLLKR